MKANTDICQQAIVHSEGHMDDGLRLSRCQREESRTARLIRSASLLFTHFSGYFLFREGILNISLPACHSKNTSFFPVTAPTSALILYSSPRKQDHCSQHGHQACVPLPGEMMKRSLQDLIGYLRPAPQTLEHQAKRHNMVVLKERQNMFQQEVSLLGNRPRTLCPAPK